MEVLTIVVTSSVKIFHTIWPFVLLEYENCGDLIKVELHQGHLTINVG